ncbi:MAG: CPBP family intramembrane metalloprotease [Clostridia bacterium]|nr:CPBP family intramembrane metalloprotease [Clostridia bacterium]
MNPTPETNEITPIPPRDLAPARRQIGTVALAIAFIFAGSLLLQVLAVTVLELFAPQLKYEPWYAITVSSSAMYLVMPFSLFLYRTAEARKPTETKALSIPVFLGLVAICFSVSFLGNIVGTVVNTIVSSLTGRDAVNELEALTVNTPFWANLLFCGILAPLMEEIFFRKLVIDRLRGFGDLPAILLSGIAFGLLHGNFNQFFYATFMGLLFGYVYLYTGKLRYTVALHAAINLVSGVGMTELIKRIDLDLLASAPLQQLSTQPIAILLLLLYYIFLWGCFVGAIVAVSQLYKHVRFTKAEQPLTKLEWRAVLLKNPSVWLFAAMVVFLFVL